MKYRWGEEEHRWLPLGEWERKYRGRSHGVIIQTDIEPFVSTVDGTLITSRSKLREHNKRHGVTSMSDYSETWARAAEERAKSYTGGDDETRRQSIAAAFAKANDK